MEFDTLFDPPTANPVIDDRIAATTLRLLPTLCRITIQVQRGSTEQHGWAKVNSISVSPPRTDELVPDDADERINTAIMQVALVDHEEFGPAAAYRALYRCQGSGGDLKRVHVQFRIENTGEDASQQANQAAIASRSQQVFMETLMENNLALAEANRLFCESMLPHLSVNREALGYFRQGMQMVASATAATQSPSEEGFISDFILPVALQAIQARMGGKGAAALEGAVNNAPKALPGDGQSSAAPNDVPTLVQATRAFLGSVTPEQWAKLNKVLEPADADSLEAAGQAETNTEAATAIRRLQQQLLADFGRLPKIQAALSQDQIVDLLRLAAEASRVGTG